MKPKLARTKTEQRFQNSSPLPSRQRRRTLVSSLKRHPRLEQEGIRALMLLRKQLLDEAAAAKKALRKQLARKIWRRRKSYLCSLRTRLQQGKQELYESQEREYQEQIAQLTQQLCSDCTELVFEVCQKILKHEIILDKDFLCRQLEPIVKKISRMRKATCVVSNRDMSSLHKLSAHTPILFSPSAHQPKDTASIHYDNCRMLIDWQQQLQNIMNVYRSHGQQ